MRLRSEKILIGDIRSLPQWAGERVAAGVYRLTAPASGWRAPELRCSAELAGARFEVLQSLTAGERVFVLKVFGPNGKPLELEQLGDYALELWSYPRPGDVPELEPVVAPDVPAPEGNL